MVQVIYGLPFPLPPGADYYKLNNENVGFNATLDTTQESYSFYLPLPGSINKHRQTIVVHALEFMVQAAQHIKEASSAALVAFLSTRGEVPAPTNDLNATDGTDSFFKAQFMDNIWFGKNQYQPVDASLAGPIQWILHDSVDAMVYPHASLDQFGRPLHIHLFRQTVTVDPATQVVTVTDFTAFEKFQMRVWFTPRNLSRRERRRLSESPSDRYAILDA